LAVPGARPEDHVLQGGDDWYSNGSDLVFVTSWLLCQRVAPSRARFSARNRWWFDKGSSPPQSRPGPPRRVRYEEGWPRGAWGTCASQHSTTPAVNSRRRSSLPPARIDKPRRTMPSARPAPAPSARIVARGSLVRT